jgi:hypothetical protein
MKHSDRCACGGLWVGGVCSRCEAKCGCFACTRFRPALRRLLGPPELPGRLWCWRVISPCSRCGAGVGVLCQKLSPHPLPTVILLPPDKSSTCRRFRYVTRTVNHLRRRKLFDAREPLPPATRDELLAMFDAATHEDEGSFFSTDT